jgi:hypothetical protein
MRHHPWTFLSSFVGGRVPATPQFHGDAPPKMRQPSVSAILACECDNTSDRVDAFR